VVIKGDEAARLYKETMISLGVTISPAKTHASQGMFEFAKRWYIESSEVSPFPIWSLIEAHTNPIKICMRLNNRGTKGWAVEDFCRTRRIRDYLVQVFGLYRRIAEVTSRRAIIFKDFIILMNTDDEPVQQFSKIAGLAHRVLKENGQSTCNHWKHVVGSLQRAFNDSSAEMAHKAITELDRLTALLVGDALQHLPPAVASIHPAKIRSQALAEQTTDGALFYRDLAAYHAAGLKTTGIPLSEPIKALAKIVPLSRFPLGQNMFDRAAVRVMNTQAELIKILIPRWENTFSRPGDQNLRSPELGRVLANAANTLRGNR
jgi:hypothetical protein